MKIKEIIKESSENTETKKLIKKSLKLRNSGADPYEYIETYQ